MSRRALASALACAALALGAAPAGAQSAVEQAKTYFNAGSQAYEAGRFLAAVQAFQEAYRLSGRPGPLFSMAQAYRRQYSIDKRPEHLQLAVRHYREYIGKVEQGGRRADAAQALAELEPMAAKMGLEAASPQAPDVKPQTRLMVSSQTRGALASLDGAKPVEMPLIEEVPPGKHRLSVTAEGYFPEEREILAVEGSLVGVDVPLREKPATLELAAPSGADVSIDGRLVGTTPLPKPLDVAAGKHLVTITKTGHHPFSQELELARGEARRLPVELARTGQRTASWVLLGVGALGIVAGGAMVGLAYREQTLAEDILAEREAGNITAERLGEYTDAVGRREDDKRIAAVAFGAGAAIGVTGLLMFVFDQPSVAPPGTREEPRPGEPSPKPEEGTMEVSAAPVWSPEFLGGAVRGRF